MPSRPVSQKLTWTLTSTGESTETAWFGTGMSAASYLYSNPTTSTKSIITVQGSFGGSTAWFALTAATTLSTGSTNGVTNSTVTATFDKIRLSISGKTTNAGTGTVWVIAR